MFKVQISELQRDSRLVGQRVLQVSWQLLYNLERLNYFQSLDRHLTSEITQEWNDLSEGVDQKKTTPEETTKPAVESDIASTQDVELTLSIEPVVKITKEDLLQLSKEIVAFYMKHNAEADACDLLMEIEQVELMVDYVEKETYQRVCLYLLSCVPYVPEPEDTILIKQAMNIYLKFQQDQLALRCAIQLNDMDLIQSVFYNCKDRYKYYQLYDSSFYKLGFI